MTSDAPQLEAVCPYCRGKIRLPQDQSVEQVRCQRCNEQVPLLLLEARAKSASEVISQTSTAQGTSTTGEPSAPRPPQPPQEEPPTEVRVKCRLCGTLVYAPLEQVGEEVKCPDCDSMNRVPPPPKAEKKIEVQLEEGDTFQLLDGVDQPNPASASSQTKWHMAQCPTCYTHIRVTSDQAGSQLQCPDCHTQFTVAEPPPPPREPQVREDNDGYDLRLSEPVERPAVDVDDLLSMHQVPLPQELQAAANNNELDTREQLESMHKLVKGKSSEEQSSQEPSTEETSQSERWRGGPSDAEAKTTESNSPESEKPKRRRFGITAQDMFLKKLFVSDLGAFTSEGGLIIRWVIMAAAISFTLWFGASTVRVLQQEMDPASSVFMAVQSIGSALLLLFCLVVIANTMLPIIVSAGLEEEKVEDWPAFSAGDWLFQVFYVINALAVGAIPSVIFVPLFDMPWLAIFQWLTIVPIFPIAMLSMLDEGSPFAPYSPGLWTTITVYKGLWWRFTALGYLMAAVGMLLGGAVFYGGQLWLAIVAGVAIASLIVLYARFVGRLAMFMSEQSAPRESLAEFD